MRGMTQRWKRAWLWLEGRQRNVEDRSGKRHRRLGLPLQASPSVTCQIKLNINNDSNGDMNDTLCQFLMSLLFNPSSIPSSFIVNVPVHFVSSNDLLSQISFDKPNSLLLLRPTCDYPALSKSTIPELLLRCLYNAHRNHKHRMHKVHQILLSNLHLLHLRLA